MTSPLCALLLSIALAPQSAPRGGAPAPTERPVGATIGDSGAWQRAAVFTRLLEQKVRDIASELTGAVVDRNTAVASLLARQGSDSEGGSTAQNRVTNAWLDAVRRSSLLNSAYPSPTGDGAIESRSEFVPDIGAVISLSVPVACDAAPVGESETAPARVPSATERDDAEWEAAANGRYTERRTEAAATDASEPAIRPRLEFWKPSLAKLHDLVLDQAWRFGARLELAPGERLLIVVTATPSVSPQLWQPFERAAPSDRAASTLWWELNALPPGGAANPGDSSVSVAPSSSPYLLLALQNRLRSALLPPSPQRMIVAITAEQLSARRDGRMTPAQALALPVASGDF